VAKRHGRRTARALKAMRGGLGVPFRILSVTTLRTISRCQSPFLLYIEYRSVTNYTAPSFARTYKNIYISVYYVINSASLFVFAIWTSDLRKDGLHFRPFFLSTAQSAFWRAVTVRRLHREHFHLVVRGAPFPDRWIVRQFFHCKTNHRIGLDPHQLRWSRCRGHNTYLLFQ